MWDWFKTQYTPLALWSAWGAVVLGYAAFLLLERFIPAQRRGGRREFAADIRANLVFFLLNPLALVLGGALSGPIARFLGGPQFRLGLNLFANGPVSRFLLALVPFLIFDFFYYWFHRCQHAFPWLWQEHRLHHSERFLNATTNFRHHWLEEFFRAFFIFLPMNWLFAISPVESAAAAVVTRQWSTFFHSNIRVSLGPFATVITGPQYHRIHHSIEPQHTGKNYAAFFPLWDWVFGSYWGPKKDEWPETGLPETDGVWSLPEILFSPFSAWWQRLAGRVK